MPVFPGCFANPVMRVRPLSPHLGLYRFPITAVLSITHRFTGLVLTVGLVCLAGVLVAAACGEAVYAPLRGWLASMPGRLLLGVWLYGWCFHLCHGVRHLLWDVGWGYERRYLARYAWCELMASFFLFAVLRLGARVWMGG